MMSAALVMRLPLMIAGMVGARLQRLQRLHQASAGGAVLPERPSGSLNLLLLLLLHLVLPKEVLVLG